MEKFFACVGVLMMVILPISFVWNLVRDLAHPEWWGDWTHNPYIYCPMSLLMFAGAGVYVARVYWKCRQMDKQAMQRSAAHLEAIRKLMQK